MNHCLVDSLVLIANTKAVVTMHEYGVPVLFEILNFQHFEEDSGEMPPGGYQSYSGQVTIAEKVVVIWNQIIAELKEKTEEETKEEVKEEAKEVTKEEIKEEESKDEPVIELQGEEGKPTEQDNQ